nr:MyoA [Craspedostauros australis]
MEDIKSTDSAAATAATATSATDEDSSKDATTATAITEAVTTAAELRTSKHVYIPSKEHAWIPARIIEYKDAAPSDSADAPGPILTVSIPVYRSEQEIKSDGGRSASRFDKTTISMSIQQLPLQNVNSEGQLVPVPDMVDLPFLHEAAILYNLKARHVQALPYTRTGDIVIAVNPYQWFHVLYSHDNQNTYSEALIWKNRSNITKRKSTSKPNSNDNSNSNNSNNNQTKSQTQPQSQGEGASPTADISDPRNGLVPHVYEASALAYQGLAARGDDQSILVSGESGAGKTETVKICMSHLASIQNLTPKQRQKQRVLNAAVSSASSVASSALSTTGSASAPANSEIVQRVLDSNPLLEAFGNAKTLRNDNSSRFGKYIQLQFDNPLSHQLHNASSIDDMAVAATGMSSRQQVLAQSTGTASRCILAGSKCEVYLLEKSRVISHAEGERTFHIFYQLLAAPEEYKATVWSGLEDTDNESFCYVGWTDTNTIEGRSDEDRFQLTLNSLALVGVIDDKLKALLRAICIVLQLGNLEFAPLDDDKCVISTDEELMELAELMDVPPDELAVALLVRTVTAKGETFQVPLKAETAKDSTDAFAKEIYAKTFLWLVRTINDATCAENNYRNASFDHQRFGVIGLLDIFGFETFEVNRFEQLCINYANEKLQQKFTQDIFRSVQTEYEFEGIELGEITYDDNTDVLDLVEGGMGLLALLNEECVRPKGSDKTFVFKAQAMNKDNAVWIREPHYSATSFGIRHYAGKVTYDSNGFVTKNMDTLPTDLQDCAAKSSNAILAKELTNEAMMNPFAPVQSSTKAPETAAAAAAPKKKKKRPKGARGRPGGAPTASSASAPTSRPGHHMPRRSVKSNLVAETVWTKFKTQLSRLMTQLNDTRTRYIRCIKPNSKKRPRLMEHTMAVEQLRCAGVVAAVTISRSAFPNRLDHDVVLERFKSLWPHGVTPDSGTSTSLMDGDSSQHASESDDMGTSAVRGAVDRLLTRALQALEITRPDGKVVRGFVIGKTRTYFRAGALEYLEGERLKYLGVWATRIQKEARRYVCTCNYRMTRMFALWTQTKLRMRNCRRTYRLIRKAAIRVQCWHRVLNAAKTIEVLRRNFKATLIQTRWRMVMDGRQLRRSKEAVVVMQSMVRGALQRPKYRQALFEKKEEAKLENQLRALQRKLEEAEQKRLEAEKAAELKAAQAVKDAEEKAKAERQRTEEEQREREKKEARAEEEKKEQAAIEAAQVAEEKRKKAEEEREEMRVKLQEQEQEQAKLQTQLNAEQQTLMDESGKMLEYLRKEVFKLRNQNSQLKTDFDLLKDNNQRLMDANASAGASFVALNQHAKQLSKQNNKLQTEVEVVKEQAQQYNVMQIELKEELKMKKATYIAEVRSRLQYQKALGRVTDIVQEQCRDTRLVEKVLEVADECEMEFLAGVDGGGLDGDYVPRGQSRENVDGAEDDGGEGDVDGSNRGRAQTLRRKSSLFGSLSSYFS